MTDGGERPRKSCIHVPVPFDVLCGAVERAIVAEREVCEGLSAAEIEERQLRATENDMRWRIAHRLGVAPEYVWMPDPRRGDRDIVCEAYSFEVELKYCVNKSGQRETFADLKDDFGWLVGDSACTKTTRRADHSRFVVLVFPTTTAGFNPKKGQNLRVEHSARWRWTDLVSYGQPDPEYDEFVRPFLSVIQSAKRAAPDREFRVPGTRSGAFNVTVASSSIFARNVEWRILGEPFADPSWAIVYRV